MANKIASDKGGLIESAKLDEFEFKHSKNDFDKYKNKFDQAFDRAVKYNGLSKDTIWHTEPKDDPDRTILERILLRIRPRHCIKKKYVDINYFVHIQYQQIKREESLWRRRIKHLMIGGFILLLFLTYYPLIMEIVSQIQI